MPTLADRAQRARTWSAARWCVVLAACGLGLQLAACADQLPLAPAEQHSATIPLPLASYYIIELGAPGAVPSGVEQMIRDAGGRIVRVQRDMGIALVAGLSQRSAESLRAQNGIRLVLPDVRRQFVRKPVLTSRLVLTRRPAGDRTVTAQAANPRTAQFFADQWNMTQIRADSAWRVTTQGAGTSVFIIDSGIDPAHIDLVGRVDTARSVSFAFNGNDSQDTVPLPYDHDVVGHGTFVSSLVATNSLGIAAVAPQARLVMVRVLDDQGSGDDFSVISGVLYAADHGADVINMSLGGYLDRANAFDLAIADLFQRAIDYATERGALVVAAAGNESINTNTGSAPHGSYADSMHTPAGGLLHVLSVGATGPVDRKKFDQIAEYSNYGSADVAVFAPGGNTVDSAQTADLVLGACSSAASPMCVAEDSYFFGAGTSFASPLAAAEAAVIKSHALKKPTPAELESCLLKSAFEVNGVRPDTAYGFGRIDVLKGAMSSACK